MCTCGLGVTDSSSLSLSTIVIVTTVIKTFRGFPVGIKQENSMLS
jgi:hypothetical protein